MSDSFGSVWDAADPVQDEASLRALTSARIEALPAWSFISKSASAEEFTHRFALVEEQVRTAAANHGVDFEEVAKSLVDDFRAMASFYVEDGGEKVGGPYDSKADAQDAIDGGDVSGDNLTVADGGSDDDGDSDDGDDDEDGQDSGDSDGDDSDSDEDQDDAEGEPSDSGNPFAKKESVLSRLDEAFPVIKIDAGYHSVVHQPGETVFVDHFMGHDVHEGRKGVWAQVVSSPGQHGHQDREDSHLLKPMAPGGTQFFHHFGGLQKQAYGDGPIREQYHYHHGIDGFRSGLGTYPDAHTEPTRGTWKPHRVYDSISSAVNHLAGGAFNPHEERGDDLPGYGNLHHEQARDHAASLESYNHCNSCDHVYSTNHPDHQTAGHKDVCPNCHDTDFHESVSDVLSDSGYYSKSQDRDHDGAGEAHSEDNYGDPYGKMDRRHESSLKTALPDGVDPLQWIVSTVPGGEGEAEKEAHHDTSVRMASLIDLFQTATSE